MAPFLVRHPVLIAQLVSCTGSRARARVRSQPSARGAAQAGFLAALAAMQDKVRTWRTADMRQTRAIAALDADLATLERKTAEPHSR